MQHGTDQLNTKHPPGLPEPSYVSLTLTTMAAELERVANRRTLLTDLRLRSAYVASVAAVTGTRNLPDAVANEVGEKVADLLPDPALTITHGETVARLRQLAGAV